MVTTDPRSAAGWVMSLPDENVRVLSMRSMAARWGGIDSHEASEWADALPSGPERDAAAHGLAQVIVSSEPEAAWVWAASIADPAARLNALEDTVRGWAETDPQRARQHIAAAELETNERDALLRIIASRGSARSSK
jgi:hypothetical protein